MRIAALLLLALPTIAVGQSLKQSVYNSILAFSAIPGGAPCSGWTSTLTPDAVINVPAGDPTITPDYYCSYIQRNFAGMGAYPADLWIGNDTVAFHMHIRALSKTGCFVDWPQVVFLRFNGNRISEWWQFFDGDWQEAQIHCNTPQMLLTQQPKALLAGNIKQAFYNAIVTFSTQPCSSFSQLFAPSSVLQSPYGGTRFIGSAGALQYCTALRQTYAGFGAYPEDLWIGATTVATKFHIRALSAKGCHVTWPSVLRVTFDADANLITEWSHFYDAEWNDAQLKC
eukprot:TRINITY_DN41807_c0_g1_i1.p1 TRINITY_DN41807_c0_g1~~TRINITY_DN41807_c0_g1_i1.p1  ORF type:complete len:292 (+),score=34.22 TRINITY_DN41807_c0_g1_i1:27-878(+)